MIPAVLPARKVRKSARKAEITYPYTVSKGSIRVTIYRVVNAARGEVFEVTWFQGGTRKRKAFRSEVEALNQAEETVKALDTGKGESLTLSTAEFESFQLAKNTLSTLADPPPLHLAMEEFVAVKKLMGNAPLLSAIQGYVTEGGSKSTFGPPAPKPKPPPPPSEQ